MVPTSSPLATVPQGWKFKQDELLMQETHWDEAKQKTILDSEKKEWMTYYELRYYDPPNDTKNLKFTINIFGTRPAAGYPLYIALHGGGGGDYAEGVNNDEWFSMATGLYRIAVSGGTEEKGYKNQGAIYIAARQVTNEWHGHFQAESYPLLERLIMDLLGPFPQTGNGPLVDSNRVFLVGFSSGGDGVYQLSTKISDRFAAVNMSAGHPNDTKFENLANLPICLQVGVEDLNHSRPTVTVETNFKLGALKNFMPARYINSCFVHKPGDHNSWLQPQIENKKLPVLENLPAWYAVKKGSPTVPQADAEKIKEVNTSSIDWVSGFWRNPIPSQVVWNLQSRPPKPADPATGPKPFWTQKQFFYWIFVRDPNSEYAGTIRASYSKQDNSVQIDEPKDYVGILLNDRMLTLNAPIIVKLGKLNDPTTTSVTISVSPSEQIKKETFQARRDSQLVFSVMIYFELDRTNKWVVKSADTLKQATPLRPRL